VRRLAREVRASAGTEKLRVADSEENSDKACSLSVAVVVKVVVS
jgi:hypothetical protein